MRWDEIDKITSKEPEDGLWFRHLSPKKHHILRPLSYEELSKSRIIEGPSYVNERKNQELQYHTLLKQNPDKSFLYATIVGKNKMESSEEYPGYIYYFKLTKKQIKQCIFDIVDIRKWMEPTIGIDGIKRAIKIWNEHNNQMVSQPDDILGTIDPRIEVIIPFAVEYNKYIPQIEDR